MKRRDLLRALASTPALAVAQPQAQPSRARPPFIECADGTRLFFRDWGTGRPVVFAPPWALNADWWEPQVASLSGRGIRCIVYDRRGHGRSSEPGRGYDLDTLADDLSALFVQLDLRDVVLVGHSMGAAEVVRYVARHGTSRVARVVLVATITPFILKTADNPDGVDRAALERGRELLLKEGPQRIADAAPAFFGAPAIPVAAETMAWWTRMMVDRCPMSVMLALHRAFTESDFRPDLPKVTVPTLLIHGDKDASTPLDRSGRRTQALIPGSVLKVYEGAAHGLTITHAERLNADLVAFIEGRTG